MAFQHLKGIVQAVRQSAASTGCLFSQWSATSTSKPTISAVGGVETGRIPENEGTPMQYLFLEIPRNDPLPHLPGRKLVSPRGRRLRSGLRKSRWQQGLAHYAARNLGSKPPGSLPRSFESPEIFDLFCERTLRNFRWNVHKSPEKSIKSPKKNVSDSESLTRATVEHKVKTDGRPWP